MHTHKHMQFLQVRNKQYIGLTYLSSLNIKIQFLSNREHNLRPLQRPIL
jgi:hypothetical protein